MATRFSQIPVEVLIEGDPATRFSQAVVEVLVGGESDTRFSQVTVEVLVSEPAAAPPPCFITIASPESIAARYYCVLQDQTGAVVAIFDDWRSLNITKNLNGISSYQFIINGNDTRADLFELDGQFLVYRSVPGVGLDWYLEYVGLHRSEVHQTFENGNTQFTSYGVSAEDLLRRRVIGYRLGTVEADIDNEPVETAMKNAVAENIIFRDFSNEVGVTYDFDGTMANVTVEADGGLGATYNGTIEFKNLLEILQDLADHGGIDFSMERIDNLNWQFTTHENQLGLDRTTTGLDYSTGLNAAGNAPFVFAIERGNVSEMSYAKAHLEETNAILVLGQGSRSTRKVVSVENAVSQALSPWNRAETVRSANSQTTLASMEDAGERWLFEGQYRETFSWTPLQQPSSLYGLHYQMGDRVTGEYRGISRNKRITGVTITITGDNRKEELQFDFKDVP